MIRSGFPAECPRLQTVSKGLAFTLGKMEREATPDTNSRLESLEKRCRKLERILQVSRALGTEMNLDRVLILIMRTISEAMEAERSSLFLIDSEKRELISRVAEGEKEIRFPM